MNWWTADPHLGHANIIKHCDRPFKDVDEMDRRLIENWNSIVSDDDTVYLLGDVALGSANKILRYLGQLNGKIHLIAGNHDKAVLKGTCAARFESISTLLEIWAGEKQKIVMCHYPMLTWNKSNRGAWQLHGHCHGTLTVTSDAKRLDVGVDCHEFKPISFDRIKRIMARKTFKPVDHHD